MGREKGMEKVGEREGKMSDSFIKMKLHIIRGRMLAFVLTHWTSNFLISYSTKGRKEKRVMVSCDPAVMLPCTFSGQYWAHFTCAV